MGSELVPLNAVQRFQKIRNYFFTDDGEESFILPFQDMVQAGRDFRNSILPHSVRNHKSYMEFDEECMRILFAAVLPTRLNEEKLIFELTDFPFYTCLTIDTAYIPREVLRGKSATRISTMKMRSGRKYRPMQVWVTSIVSRPMQRKRSRPI